MKKEKDFQYFYKTTLKILVGIISASLLIIIGYAVYLGLTSANVYTLSFDWSIDDENREDLYVKINKNDFWVTEKGIATSCDAKIVNKTKYTIYDWKVEVNTPIKSRPTSMWNGEWTSNAGVSTFTPQERSNRVAAMSNQSFGVIFTSKEELDLNQIFLTYKRTIALYDLPVFWFFAVLTAVSTIAASILAVSYIQVKNYKNTHASYKDLVQESLRTIANIIDTKDEYTRGHSIRVAIYSRMLAERMGLSEYDQERLYYIGMLHDIGKIGIPSSILTKPGRLDDEEFEIIKRHTRMGASIMKDFYSIEGVVDGIRYHHERYDGRGYNEGLKGEEIPLVGRIIGVADSYDAMSSVRCYRKNLSYDTILQELRDNAGKQFDPEIVKHMIQLVEEGYAPISEAEMEYSQGEKKKNR
ncbi:MAG: HD domain-containing protein [Lachnospiraceae bacterium]|nr:HD domain-containing protein [Lachnospiraceae bacterium]